MVRGIVPGVYDYQVRMRERTGKSQDAKIQQDRFSWIGILIIYSTVVDDY